MKRREKKLINHGHRIKLSYGNHRITASWDDWPSSPVHTVKRTHARDYTFGEENYAEWAVGELLTWMNRTHMSPRTVNTKSVSMCALTANVSIIIMTTEYAKENI